jgi:type IV pilus assembly protein PilC
MVTFNYVAKNPSTGKQVKATIQANTETDAAKSIKDSGLVPLSIKAESSVSTSGFTSFFNRVKTKDKVLFARQLSTLINAGLPLSQSLRSVADQTTSKPFRYVINQIITDIESGKSLSSALEKYPKVFNRIFVSLVAAGETSGTLDKELERIAIQQEKDADIVSKVRGAMIYPAVVMLVMIGVVVFMIVKVVPQIELLYTSFPGTTLPIETRFLISVAHIITHFWWLILLILAVVVVFLTRWLRTETGSKTLDTLKISMPPFKSLFQKIYMARFSRTSASLIGAGVPLLSVLQISSETVANWQVQHSIMKAAEKVKGGVSLGEALTNDPYFLPLVPNMLKIGEKSGAVEAMMNKAADYYETEVENIIKNISTIIEPIMMVILGIVAITIVVAILLPIYGLAGSGAISGTGS